ncbi:MAG: hypothetical protein EOP68_16705, partial [Sphingomonas sp.]
ISNRASSCAHCSRSAIMSGEMAFRLATPDMMADLLQCAHDDARLLIDRDGGLEGPRGQAARTALYLFDRDAGVALLRSG